MLRSEAKNRKCCANDHKCDQIPMFVGTDMDTGKENEVVCAGHAWKLSDPGYSMIKEEPGPVGEDMRSYEPKEPADLSDDYSNQMPRGSFDNG